MVERTFSEGVLFLQIGRGSPWEQKMACSWLKSPEMVRDRQTVRQTVDDQ